MMIVNHSALPEKEGVRGMETMSLQCTCGSVKGELDMSYRANHLVCFCEDCQTFAHFLERQEESLDERGGSRIIQVLPRALRWTEGTEKIACMRLSPKGTLRYYASCCRTPICNSPASPKLSFLGVLHSMFGDVDKIESAFGPVCAHVNTQGAQGEPKPKTFGMAGVITRFMGRVAIERMTGKYKQNPMFPNGDATPLAVPEVIAKDQRKAFLSVIRQA
jgi:hypothetical protein